MPLPSAQKYLDISEIKNDCIVMKDGTLRAVLLVSSINFALKSEEEQKAVIQAYVQFLNTIEHPFQIVIQSRPFDISPYLAQLDQLRKAQTNELLKSQMADYIDYVKELTELGEIMSKRFYVVVPYNPAGDKQRGFFSRLAEVFSAAMVVKLKAERFARYREALFRRADRTISAFSSMGINAVPLDTQSLIELFYNTYNPTTSKNEKLGKIEEMRVEE